MSRSATMLCYGALLFSVGCGTELLSQSASKAEASQRSLPAYSATLWTTLTRSMQSGTPATVTQRTVVSQDQHGQWTKTYYHSTHGPQYDTSAAVERVETGETVVVQPSLTPSLSEGQVLDLNEDLGTRYQNGLLTQGRRRTFHIVGRQPVVKHTIETWYCPSLGIVLHSESKMPGGTNVTMDITNLQIGPITTDESTQAAGASAAQPIPSDLHLYRGLFSIVAHMERARLADPPDHVENVSGIEELMREQMNLSSTEWQALLSTAVKSDASTEQATSQAREYARQTNAAIAKSSNQADLHAALRQGLHQMQLVEDGKTQRAIEELESGVGADGVARIHAYLRGPLAASAHVTHVGPQSKAVQ